jgi:hypothetical protein
MIGFRFLAAAGNFLLHHRVQTISASYSMGICASFPGERQLGHETDHSLPSRAEVKNAWRCISSPRYVFMVSYLVKYRSREYLRR